MEGMIRLKISGIAVCLQAQLVSIMVNHIFCGTKYYREF